MAKFQSGSANESNETELDANPQVNEFIQFFPIKLFCISLASEIAQVISKSWRSPFQLSLTEHISITNPLNIYISPSTLGWNNFLG